MIEQASYRNNAKIKIEGQGVLLLLQRLSNPRRGVLARNTPTPFAVKPYRFRLDYLPRRKPRDHDAW